MSLQVQDNPYFGIKPIPSDFSFSDFKLSKWDLAERKALGEAISSFDEGADTTLREDKHSWVVYDKVTDNLLMVGGVLPDEGGIWLLTSEHVEKLPVFRQGLLLCYMMNVLEVTKRKYMNIPLFFNYIWKHNLPHIDFIKTLGAVIEEEHYFTTPDNNEVFYLFTIKNEYSQE